jgi:hypothetical protein
MFQANGGGRDIMRAMVVPHDATASSINVWLGLTDVDQPPANLQLEVAKVGSVPIAPNAWRLVNAAGDLKQGDSRTFVQTVTVKGLAAHQAHALTFVDAVARASTLPLELPTDPLRPLTVLLSSCFAMEQAAGELNASIDGIDMQSPIDLKFLSGDQVYLDFPGFILGGLFSDHRAAKTFHSRYVRNWTDRGGYERLLSLGSSWFTSDDHEFWNNYPNPAIHIPKTLTQGGRAALTSMERSLFEDFQRATDPKAVNRRFNVGELSFMVSDTRLAREPGDDRFMDDQSFGELIDWCRTLPGPGVLVAGQPLFTEPTGLLGKLKDLALPDYRQYVTLVDALTNARHSVLILTGDVHFARVAKATMPTAAATDIFEVIASPIALVAGKPGKSETPPDFFPSKRVNTQHRGPTQIVAAPKTAGNNIATLQFRSASGLVHVDVTHWLLTRNGARKDPDTVSITLR